MRWNKIVRCCPWMSNVKRALLNSFYTHIITHILGYFKLFCPITNPSNCMTHISSINSTLRLTDAIHSAQHIPTWDTQEMSSHPARLTMRSAASNAISACGITCVERWAFSCRVRGVLSQDHLRFRLRSRSGRKFQISMGEPKMAGGPSL